MGKKMMECNGYRRERLLMLRSKIVYFTIVELLIVISIIVILISILLPALGKAKEQGKRIQCVHNLKQIGSALIMYAGDNGEFLPCPDTSAPIYSNNYPYNWKYTCPLVYPEYLSGGKVFYCPSNNDADTYQNRFSVGSYSCDYIQYFGSSLNRAPRSLKDSSQSIMSADKAITMWENDAIYSNHGRPLDPSGSNNLYLGGNVNWSKRSDLTYTVTKGGNKVFLYPSSNF